MSGFPCELKYKICTYFHRDHDKKALVALQNISQDWNAVVTKYLFEYISNFKSVGSTSNRDVNQYKCNPDEVEKIKHMVKTIGLYVKCLSNKTHSPHHYIKRYPNLKNIEIKGFFSSLDYDTAEFLWLHQEQVTTLCLSRFRDSDSITEYGGFKKLKTLRMYLCHIRFRLFDILDHFPNLEELDVSTYEDLEFEITDITKYISRTGQLKTYPKIRSLEIEFKKPEIRSQLLGLQYIQKAFPNLKILSYLTVEDVREKINEPLPDEVFVLDSPFIGLTCIFQKLTKFSVLYVTEYSARLIGKYMPNLEHLTIHAYKISDKRWMTKGYQYLLTENTLLNLKTLIFNFENRGNGKGMELFKINPFESLSEPLSASNVIKVNLPNIKHLGFGRLELNPRILFVLDQLPQLERLSIKLDSFDGIDSLIHTHRHGIPNLSILDISTYFAKPTQLQQFLNLFPNIRIVNMFETWFLFYGQLKENNPNILFTCRCLERGIHERLICGRSDSQVNITSTESFDHYSPDHLNLMEVLQMF